MIRVEREESATVAVIYGDKGLGQALKEGLEKHHFRVLKLAANEAVPIFEKPAYIFFLGDDFTLFPEPGAKIIEVEIQGVLDPDNKTAVAFSVNKIVRAALAGESKIKILGKQEHKKFIPEIFKPQPKKKNYLFLLVLLVPLVLFVLLAGIFLGRTAWNLKTAKNSLEKGDFATAEILAQKSKDDFGKIKKYWPVKNYFDFLLLGETGADIISHAASVGLQGKMMAQNMTVTNIPALRAEIGIINQDLGLLAAQKYDFPEIRKGLGNLDSVLSVWPEIAPPTGKKVYLVVFQNSAELRPTGGFIGSYGLVKIENGALANWEIFDIYTADGQLRGHIDPPDEILRFAGQQSWYMRDANWDPDWPLTAQRLEWFLEKETGQTVDGVIGVNLGLMQKLLAVSGPLDLLDLNLTVSADDFFAKAESAAEINFFAGSSQKKDFLGAAAKALQGKLPVNLALGKALSAALEQKDLLFYFNNPKVQKVFSNAGWGGELKNFDLAIIEANLGFNKANYFIKRSVQTKILIGKDGTLDVTVVIHYRNDSPSEAWPGGKYKNYLRIFPAGFGELVEVPPQSDKTVSFTYRLPKKLAIDQDKPVLNFKIFKQPGTGADPLDIAVDYPSFLKPEKISGLAFPQRIIYNWDLTTDRNYEMHFIKS